MRDYENQLKRQDKEVPSPECLAEHYTTLFQDLHEKIDSVTRKNIRSAASNQSTPFSNLDEDNYQITGKSENLENFCNNLRNTEIDIVLESPKHLFIGEAKYESDFGTEGEHVLVHQLIRQYVTTWILLKLTQPKTTHPDDFIVPFLVVDAGKIDSVKNTAQVEFMVSQKWLKEKNILTWDQLVLLG